MGSTQRNLFFMFTIAFSTMVFYSFEWMNPPEKNQDHSSLVSQQLSVLGENLPWYLDSTFTPQEIERGQSLVYKGYYTLGTKKSKKQSKHFTCKSCHNTQREDPVLYRPSAESRLEYAVEHNLPFLQGTTLWGAVNREHWYNDDYYKKYGSLVKNAQDNLESAIQLCATECAQGRALTQEEMRYMLAYLSSLQVKMSDLDLTEKETHKISNASSPQEKKQALSLLKSKYLLASGATFTDVLSKDKRNQKANPQTGKQIYTQSCLHCHNPKNGVTNYTLDISKIDIKHLKKNVLENNPYSIYTITRVGTSPIPGYKPYMPHYR